MVDGFQGRGPGMLAFMDASPLAGLQVTPGSLSRRTLGAFATWFGFATRFMCNSKVPFVPTYMFEGELYMYGAVQVHVHVSKTGRRSESGPWGVCREGTIFRVDLQRVEAGFLCDNHSVCLPCDRGVLL